MSAVRRLVILCLLLLTVTGCSEKSYTLLVLFEPASLADDVDRISVALLDGCDEADRDPGANPGTVYEMFELRRGEALVGLSSVEPGLYGFYAIGKRGLTGECRVAAGCLQNALNANGSGPVSVVLKPIPERGCDEPDAGTDSGMDGGTLPDVRECVEMNGGVEACNDEDDDCDGKTDEDFSLRTNPDRCGSCDNDCPADQGCADGVCAPRATELALGAEHTCARRADGRALCWGTNSAFGAASGQLGTGDFTPRSKPTLVPNLSDVVHVSACGFTTCAVLEDGTGQCWGLNNAGQVGDGSVFNRSSPVQVIGLEGADDIGMGAFHTCAIHGEGELSCWGWNAQGELGIGQAGTYYAVPQAVEDLPRIEQVQGGYEFTCARAEGGAMYCWGANNYGQLGIGEFGGTRNEPVRVMGLSDAKDFAVGGGHVCAIRESGEIMCWGDGQYGQLLTGSTSRSAPVTTGIVNGEKMSSGNAHVCALLTDDSITCWAGGNEYGNLGNGTINDGRGAPPGMVIGLTDAVDIATAYGDAHECAIRANHNVVCWGRNHMGQLGIDVIADVPHTRFETVIGL